MIKTSLNRCSEDLRLEMAKKIIFCGGTSMIKGLYDRVDKELSSLDYDYRLEFDWQRRYSAWVGGSMIGSLSTFQQLAIKNADLSSNEIIKKILWCPWYPLADNFIPMFGNSINNTQNNTAYKNIQYRWGTQVQNRHSRTTTCQNR